MSNETLYENRVFFRFRRARANARDWEAHCGGHRSEVVKWLCDQVGVEGEDWMYVAAPTELETKTYDGFFLFEDKDQAMMFSLMFG